MTFKRPFKFDFNEDADPVEELHRLRVAATRHFKTIDALLEYHRSVPSVEELIAELDKEIAENKAKAKAARALKPKAGKTVKVAKAGKAAAHAGRRKAAARLTTA